MAGDPPCTARINIPDGDLLTGGKTVFVKVSGYGIPIRVTKACVDKAGYFDDFAVFGQEAGSPLSALCPQTAPDNQASASAA